MKRYFKPNIREVYLGTEESVLLENSNTDVGVPDKPGEGYEDMSKGNSGWDDWEE